MVNRSVTWADWDEELLALELQELQDADIDLSLTGFDTGEIDKLLALDDEAAANAVLPVPESPVSRLGDLWLCGDHRVLCGDCTSPEVVGHLLGERKPRLMVTDPPYGIELDSDWRDSPRIERLLASGSQLHEAAHHRHTETTIWGDTRADWSEAFALVPSLEARITDRRGLVANSPQWCSYWTDRFGRLCRGEDIGAEKIPLTFVDFLVQADPAEWPSAGGNPA
jgi:hypothetical protein